MGLQGAEFGRDFPYGLSRTLQSSAAETDAKRQVLGDKAQLVRALGPVFDIDTLVRLARRAAGCTRINRAAYAAAVSAWRMASSSASDPCAPDTASLPLNMKKGTPSTPMSRARWSSCSTAWRDHGSAKHCSTLARSRPAVV